MQPIFSEPGKIYFFPDALTDYMKVKYKFPAIYRWVVLENQDPRIKFAYIGEADSLCPRRINGYLNPGPSQKTNKRIKGNFNELIANNYQIRCELLIIDKLIINNKRLEKECLSDKYIRKLIENLMIFISHQGGIKLYNL